VNPTRKVGAARSLPVGGSASADSGSVPNPSGVDHTHSFWGKWIEVPLLSGYIAQADSRGTPMFISMCGNMVWMRAYMGINGITVPGATIPSFIAAARLPKIATPDRDIRYENILVRSSGYVYSLINDERYDDATALATVSTLIVDDLIYRTKL
jgi:hypothetical protein